MERKNTIVEQIMEKKGKKFFFLKNVLKKVKKKTP
jgi:hypothetical protein